VGRRLLTLCSKMMLVVSGNPELGSGRLILPLKKPLPGTWFSCLESEGSEEAKTLGSLLGSGVGLSLHCIVSTTPSSTPNLSSLTCACLVLDCVHTRGSCPGWGGGLTVWGWPNGSLRMCLKTSSNSLRIEILNFYFSDCFATRSTA
jgi:hypothetical protein